jgi:hypothetical protein
VRAQGDGIPDEKRMRSGPSPRRSSTRGQLTATGPTRWARLPKTRSGKILRGIMKKAADSEAWTMPATIDDPAILDKIGTAGRRRRKKRMGIL